jgi:hypothetical protein
MHGRQDSKYRGGDGRNAERDAEYLQVNAHFMSARQNRRTEHQPEDSRCVDRRQLLDQRHACRTNQGSERSAGEGQQHAFGQDLAGNASTTGADCEPRRHLALPRGAACQQEVRHVGTDDQQHHDDRPEQHA